jgi:hypothetical protein
MPEVTGRGTRPGIDRVHNEWTQLRIPGAPVLGDAKDSRREGDGPEPPLSSIARGTLTPDQQGAPDLDGVRSVGPVAGERRFQI